MLFRSLTVSTALDLPIPLPADAADVRDPNRCYCCLSVCSMSVRKNFMGHINRRHRDMTAAQITSLMQQDFPLLDCHCGHHCISRTGLTTHLAACTIPRPEGWNIPPRRPIAHHDDNPPALAPPLFAPAAVDPPLSYSDLLSQFRQPVYKTHHT